MASYEHDRSDEHRPRRPSRAGRPRTKPSAQHRDDAVRRSGPALSGEIKAPQLAPDTHGELNILDRPTADNVARHLVAAGELPDEDPMAALEHAKAARNRAARITAVREAIGIAADQCGDWAHALAEPRAARRMASKFPLLPLIADCERGVGRPERVIELSNAPRLHDQPTTTQTNFR